MFSGAQTPKQLGVKMRLFAKVYTSMKREGSREKELQKSIK